MPGDSGGLRCGTLGPPNPSRIMGWALYGGSRGGILQGRCTRFLGVDSG